MSSGVSACGWVRLFDRYEYLLISLMNRLYWESPGVSGCFRQCPQWLLLVSVVSVVRAGKGGTASGRGFRGSGGRVRDDGRESFPAGTWRWR